LHYSVCTTWLLWVKNKKTHHEKGDGHGFGSVSFFPESERTGPPDGGRPLRPPGAPGEHAAGVW
jgi:hypothetical protein